jgi:hypothetical protein
MDFLEDEMRTLLVKTCILQLLTFSPEVSVWAQAVPARDQNIAAEARVFRTIRDPNNGMLWRLERALGNSARPGRMILLNDREKSQVNLPAGIQLPVIRSGDRLVIEESSALVEARLEAVALNAAAQGAEFNARLAIGGKVARAMALAPGRAAFATGEGAAQR